MRIPLELITTAKHGGHDARREVTCGIFDGFEWSQVPPGAPDIGACNDVPLHWTTATDWEVKDINGDGDLDVVFNSSPVRSIV